MNRIDPHENFDRKLLIDGIGFNEQNNISFSELIKHFSSQFISRDEENINLLQYIYLMNSGE